MDSSMNTSETHEELEITPSLPEWPIREKIDPNVLNSTIPFGGLADIGRRVLKFNELKPNSPVVKGWTAIGIVTEFIPMEEIRITPLFETNPSMDGEIGTNSTIMHVNDISDKWKVVYGDHSIESMNVTKFISALQQFQSVLASPTLITKHNLTEEMIDPDSVPPGFRLKLILERDEDEQDGRNLPKPNKKRRISKKSATSTTVPKSSNKIAKRSIDNSNIDKAIDVNVDEIKCQFCNKTDNEECMLLCDGCDLGYHTICLNPPLDNLPENDWFCPICITKQKISEIEEFACKKCKKTFKTFGGYKYHTDKDVCNQSKPLTARQQEKLLKPIKSKIDTKINDENEDYNENENQSDHDNDNDDDNKQHSKSVIQSTRRTSIGMNGTTSVGKTKSTTLLYASHIPQKQNIKYNIPQHYEYLNIKKYWLDDPIIKCVESVQSNSETETIDFNDKIIQLLIKNVIKQPNFITLKVWLSKQEDNETNEFKKRWYNYPDVSMIINENNIETNVPIFTAKLKQNNNNNSKVKSNNHNTSNELDFDLFLNAGGPVWTNTIIDTNNNNEKLLLIGLSRLGWIQKGETPFVPLNENEEDFNLYAIGIDTKHYVAKPSYNPTILQVWKLGINNNNQSLNNNIQMNNTNKTSLEIDYCIGFQNKGPIWASAWKPMIIPQSNILGLLGICFGDGSIMILPIQQLQVNEKITTDEISLIDSLELNKWEYSCKDLMMISIAWNPFKLNEFCCGLTDGSIMIYELNEIDFHNYNNNTNRMNVVPITRLLDRTVDSMHPTLSAIRSVNYCPYFRDLIAAGGYDGTVKVSMKYLL